jgi:hypothetical protein
MMMVTIFRVKQECLYFSPSVSPSSAGLVLFGPPVLSLYIRCGLFFYSQGFAIFETQKHKCPKKNFTSENQRRSVGREINS